jgi:hypothetical protein
VANDDSIVAFAYSEGQTQVQGAGTKVFDLPGGPINHHWTKNIIASPDGQKLYASVGSNSNVGENGLAAEAGRAQIVEFTLPEGPSRPYATGLRNPNGMDWEPVTGKLWTAVNERDELGERSGPRLHDQRHPGRLLWLALQLLRPARRHPRQTASGRTWWPRPWFRTTRSDPTRRPSAWPSIAATPFLRPTRAASSSASTAPGTAGR